jgi:hypothetical protein
MRYIPPEVTANCRSGSAEMMMVDVRVVLAGLTTNVGSIEVSRPAVILLPAKMDGYWYGLLT